MILVLASAVDRAARAFAERTGGFLATPARLSTPGWSLRIGRAGTSTGWPASDGPPAGVLVRLERVRPFDLPQIAPADRTYVASEMTAFLRAWLFAVEAPVLDVPTPQSLSGPGWSLEQWRYRAKGAGLAVAPAQDDAASEDVDVVTIVGARVIGGTRRSRELTRRLAAVAGATMLTVSWRARFEPELAGVSSWVDLDDPRVSQAVLDALTSGPC